MPPTHLIYALACLLSIPPTITSWIALLAPRYHGIKHTGALAITPPPNHDGPSIWFGLIRSCSRANASSPTECDQYSNHNLFTDYKYDVSILPPDAPLFTLRVPAVHLRGLAVTAAVLSTVFTIIAFVMALIFLLKFDARDHGNYAQTELELDRRREDVQNLGVGLDLNPEEGAMLRNLANARVWLDEQMQDANRLAGVVLRHDQLNQHLILLERLDADRGAHQNIRKQMAQRKRLLDGLRILSAAVSFSFGFVGAITFAILWVHYESACRNFNLIYKRNGTPAIPLEASLGLTFNLAYAGYIMAVIPLIIVFYELHEKRDNWRWVNEGRGVVVARTATTWDLLLLALLDSFRPQRANPPAGN